MTTTYLFTLHFFSLKKYFQICFFVYLLQCWQTQIISILTYTLEPKSSQPYYFQVSMISFQFTLLGSTLKFVNVRTQSRSTVTKFDRPMWSNIYIIQYSSRVKLLLDKKCVIVCVWRVCVSMYVRVFSYVLRICLGVSPCKVYVNQ